MGYKCIISTFKQLKEGALALNRKNESTFREGRQWWLQSQVLVSFIHTNMA